MTDSTYTDLVDTAVIDRSRALHAEAIERLNVAEAAVQTATAAVADAEANAQRAAAGETDLDPLAAEHALADRNIELASAVRVRDAAVTRRARTERNIGASESLAYRPVGIAAARARIAACEKFTRGRVMQEEAAAEFIAAERDGIIPARARGVPLADSGNGRVRELRDELVHWNAIKHVVDLDTGTFAGMPNGFIS